MRAPTRMIALAALVLTACEGGTTDSAPKPKDVTGTYTLRAFAERPRPVTVLNAPREGVRTDLAGGTLILGADGSAVQRDSIETYMNGVLQRASASDSRGTYTVRGDSLFLVLGVSAQPGVAVFTGERLQFHGAGGTTTYEYSR